MGDKDGRIVIAGAGVAGLSAAYRLEGESDIPFIVFEKAKHIGGYSRTMQHGGFRFDLGGHRFYTKKAEIQGLLERLVGEDLLQVDRLSRILFNNRFVDYPLSAFNTLKALGMIGAGRAVFDYGAMKFKELFSGGTPEETFEQWALHRFGEYLYRSYFRLYTEKTWGVPCNELSADFAEQRIKGLSFREAVKDAIFKKGADDSLVRRFVYPRYGFGQIPEAMARAVVDPNRILTDHAVVEVEHDGDRITAVTAMGPQGATVRQPCCELINCMPLHELVEGLRPAARPEVLKAARQLRYRSLVILALFLDVQQASPDHWIYVPSPQIGFGRVHEPKNWSAEMAPAGRTSLVLEYFCQEGDATWRRDSADLAAEAAADLEGMGLIERGWVSDFVAIRLPRAYPIYNVGYKEHLDAVQGCLARFQNLYNIGRNATFLYTSSDHYMDMGLKAAENVLGHEHDLAEIGRERSYAES